jgi:hypothetical protein
MRYPPLPAIRNALIGVIHSGVEADHPDLKGNILPGLDLTGETKNAWKDVDSMSAYDGPEGEAAIKRAQAAGILVINGAGNTTHGAWLTGIARLDA